MLTGCWHFWSEFPKDAALFGFYHHINMTHDPGNEKTHQWKVFVNPTTLFLLGKVLEKARSWNYT